MRLALMLVLVLLLPQCLSAAPLADRVPADAIVYVGWQGSRAAGPAYEASRMKQVVDVSDIGQMRRFVERLAARIGRDEAAVAEAAAVLTPVADVLWASPTAIYVGPVDKLPTNFKCRYAIPNVADGKVPDFGAKSEL